MVDTFKVLRICAHNSSIKECPLNFAKENIYGIHSNMSSTILTIIMKGIDMNGA